MPPCHDVVWDTSSARSREHLDRSRVGGDDRTEPDSARTRPAAPYIVRLARRLTSILVNPTFLQLHGRSPLETTRIARTSVTDAAEALERWTDVEWGHGRAAGHLLLAPFRAAPRELGRPRIADGMLYGHGFRRLSVTVAIHHYGTGRCGIQIRPRYRRPRTSRRLRHCLRSTHGAADRLRDIVLTVDFMPPFATATTG